jgi:hypothetical protein
MSSSRSLSITHSPGGDSRTSLRSIETVLVIMCALRRLAGSVGQFYYTEVKSEKERVWFSVGCEKRERDQRRKPKRINSRAGIERQDEQNNSSDRRGRVAQGKGKRRGGDDCRNEALC